MDGLGYPKRIRLTAGQRHDILKAPDLIAGLQFERIIGDRSYSSFAFVSQIVESGIEVVIPSHPRENEPRDYDAWLYRERHLVECCINKMKHFRRVFSRFDKLATSFLGFLHFVGTLIWLR